jgi:xylulokinase
MSELVLTIDCSTSGAKAIAWDLNGAQVSTGATELGLSIPHPGYGEQDPAQWWDATVIAVKKCLEGVDPKRITAVAVTHQRESFACLDAQGKPLRPAMLWLDTRAASQVDRFGTHRIHELTGKPANPTPAFFKLLWMRENEPEILDNTSLVVDVHAYVTHRMTGAWRTSVASADPLGLLDISTRDYSDEILEIVGLKRSQLPKLVEPGDLIGQLTPLGAQALGLPIDLPVIAGSGDGQSAGLGAGIITPGRAYLNLGTGLIAGSFSQTYLPHTAYRAMAGTLPGSVNYELFVGAGTFMVSWFLNNIAGGHEIPPGISAEVFWENQAAQIPRGSEGLFVLPYWNGQLTPFWDKEARGVMFGFTGSHTTAHIYRAILEGIAFELKLCLDEALKELPEGIDEFVTMGGGSRSPLWCQILADVLQRPIVLAGSDEATSLGTGILAALGAGYFEDPQSAVESMTSTATRYEPEEASSARYAELYQVYRDIYPALRPVYQSLAEVMRGE